MTKYVHFWQRGLHIQSLSFLHLLKLSLTFQMGLTYPVPHSLPPRLLRLFTGISSLSHPQVTFTCMTIWAGSTSAGVCKLRFPKILAAGMWPSPPYSEFKPLRLGLRFLIYLPELPKQ